MDGSESADALPVRPAPGQRLGAQLRAARTARSLSLAQAAEALRLEAQSVTALEEERFDQLGAPVFVRGHLRRYAELLGLSAETVLEAYRAITPDSDTLPELSRSRESCEPRRAGPWVWWLAAAALLLMVVLAWTGSRSRPAPTPAAAVPAVDGAAPQQPVGPSAQQPMVPAALPEPVAQPTVPPTAMSAAAETPAPMPAATAMPAPTPAPAPIPAPADAPAMPAGATGADSPGAAGGD